jgi:FkbM family methyltransferase
MISEARLKELVTRGPYALIGAGQLGAMSMGLWPTSAPPPEFMLDSVKTGDIRGVEIRDLRSHERVPGVTYLASAFVMSPSELNTIFQRIGQDELLTVYDFFEEFTPTVFSNGWRKLAPMAETEQRLARLQHLYADETSRNICRAATAWRYRRELLNDYPLGSDANKYNLALFGRTGTHYNVVYDGGCFAFTLVKSLTAAGVTFDKYHAFEPDPASHEICRQQIAALQPQVKAQITLDRRALSDRSGLGTFIANGLLAARLINVPSFHHPKLTTVDTCTLDSVHEQALGHDKPEMRRTLIKLHIEGAELAALKGAEQLIRQNRADILVNLSHDEKSYLDIPEFLAKFGCYDIFLRSHSLFGEGLTLFARHKA